MGYIYNRFSENDKRKKLREVMPRAEVILWSKLKSRQFHGLKFRRQFGVGPFVIDFYCAKHKLAIELDGPSHFEDDAEEYDKNRQQYIEQFGIQFLRFMNSEIYENLDGVLDSIYLAVIEDNCPK